MGWEPWQPGGLSLVPVLVWCALREVIDLFLQTCSVFICQILNLGKP